MIKVLSMLMILLLGSLPCLASAEHKVLKNTSSIEQSLENGKKPVSIWVWSKKAFEDRDANKVTFITKEVNDQYRLNANVNPAHLDGSNRRENNDSINTNSNSIIAKRLNSFQKAIKENLKTSNPDPTISGYDE